MNFNINSLEEKFNNIDTYSMEINKSVNNFTNKKQIESVVCFLFLLLKYEYQVLLGVFILGIIAHRLFCVRTTIDKKLFN